MPAYLSPQRARRMELGQVLPPSDLSLAELISQAQGIVDAYCLLPTQPYPLSFLGGEDIVEQHRWRFPESWHLPGQRRVYPYHKPIRRVSAFSIIVGQGAAAAIPTTSLVINNTEGWIEITALSIATSSGLFGVTGWVVPIGGLQEPVAEITIDAGWDIPVEDEPLYATDNTNLIFQSASHEHWIDDGDAPVVYVDGTPASPQPTINYRLGKVAFGSAQTGDITADFRHRLVDEIPLATGLILARLAGDSKLRAKAMEGLESVKDDQIEIRRPRPSVVSGAGAQQWLDREVPAAAALLGGFKYWRIG